MIDIRIGPDVVPAAALRLELPDDPAAVRTAAGRAARDLPPGRSVLDASGLSGDRLAAFVEGLALGTYRFTIGAPPSESSGPSGPSALELTGVGDRAAVECGRRVGEAAGWARDLANTPAGVADPAWLAGQAQQYLTPLGVRVTVRDPAWLAAQKFGGVLAVGGGSASAPRLIEAAWRPRGTAGGPHLVLVGKGITFDTGGINLKPAEAMRLMHTDMSGGAAVLGALHATAAARLPVRVTALVPAAENAISGAAYRPGDVIRHVDGRTSEITNTDAEGRIVLADALAYAAARLDPTALIDIATLTGAVKVAVGPRMGGYFATTDELATGIAAAATRTGEAVWRLPLPGEYEGALASSIADAINAPGNPGSITAALFLRPFTHGRPWAHLDIAGPARSDADDGVINRGATAFGARLLHDWIAAQA